MLPSGDRLTLSGGSWSTDLVQSLEDEVLDNDTVGSWQLLEARQDDATSTISSTRSPVLVSPVDTSTHSEPFEGASEPPPVRSTPIRPVLSPLGSLRGGSTRDISLPNSSQENSPQPDAPTEIRNLPLVFAVDVSASTRGRVLHQEKAAISYLTSDLEPATLADQSHILPWDRQPYDPISSTLVETLRNGSGTDPSAIFENELNRQYLQETNIWFLMTDGAIKEPRVNAFANKIAETGLHGTAAVIIVFGNRSRSPSRCNVSVGMSVFAVSPHCVFLFHDVMSGELFVLHAKGSFASLLPEDSTFTSFGPETRWEDLNRTTYVDLSRVKIPSPIQLSKDEVVLPNGKIFNMMSIYNNTVTEQERLQLLSNYAALDVILLVAKTRGESFLVKLWIESLHRSNQKAELTLVEREDIDSRGKRAMKWLLMAIEASPDTHEDQPGSFWDRLTSSTSQTAECVPGSPEPSSHYNIDYLRDAVRLQNSENWCRFEDKMEAEWKLSRRVIESLAEVQSAMSMLDDASSGPASLTPMSSLPSNFYFPTGGSSLGRGSAQRRSPLSQEEPNSSYRESSRQRNAESATLLFLPGFRGRRKLSTGAQPDAYATCPVCREPNSIQTLLLQTGPEETETPQFPLPGQLFEHKNSLVLGNCPEADVLLPITCCDGCACLLLQAGELPNGTRIAAALPLVSLHDHRNRQIWRDKLSEVYRHRFHENTVFLVFLSTLCTKIEGFTGSDRTSDLTLRQSLEWCCRELSKLPGIPMGSSSKPDGSLLSGVDGRVPPQQVAFFACLGNRIYLRTMLTYPIDGFVVLVRLATSMNVIKPEAIEKLVWKRLLYHLTEQHVGLQGQLGPEYAKDMLGDIIHGTPPSDVAVGGETHTPNEDSTTNPPKDRPASIPLSSIIGTYLIPPGSNIVEQLLRMDEYFSDVQASTKYNAALAVFLHILAHSPWRAEEPMDVFIELQRVANKLRHMGEELYNAFEDGKLVNEKAATSWISRLANLPR
ncbi:hypothetical protein FALBO_13213 [Fusarium albosuccineum]|uniref:VWFA domain-containing protein n=1 Tax=Fusarium albosuccineum TaxID=1237068 RepID=A0A8H4P2F3_9HYPO|nr:hypothetical protein FALBO_13213 [Fusarium albosuccineum]